MLSVTVQKDIGEYEQKIIGGLTMRSAAFLGLAVLAALFIGGALFLVGVPSDTYMPICMVVAAVIFFLGHYKPLGGLKMEVALPLILTQNFGQHILFYKSTPRRVKEAAVKQEADEKQEVLKRNKNRANALKQRKKAYAKALKGYDGPAEILLARYAADADAVLGTDMTGGSISDK